MTLVLGVLTNLKYYIIADKMHSIKGTKENPAKATVEIEEKTINITATNIRINGGTKIYKFSDNLYIAGTGDLEKIKNYMQLVEHETVDTIIEWTQDYYTKYKENSPDSLLLLTKTTNLAFHAFSLGFQGVTNKESFSFTDFKVIAKENSISTISIGSGGTLFSEMYKLIKEECLDKYREAIEKNEYSKWEAWFIDKIKEMYNDVSKYDNGVSSDIDIFEVEF